MKLLLFVLAYLACVLNRTSFARKDRFYDARTSHTYKILTDEEFDYVSKKGDFEDFYRVLDEILIPRVVGSPGHTKVKNFISSELESLGWNVERNNFTDKTPIFGQLRFTNIIGKLNPSADRFLVLACHYDSKYFRESIFVGAIDSAVPCAMILYLIKVLDPYLNKIKSRADLSLAVIFFDGEEAFRSWTETDSLYGSRHLANKWANQPYPLGSRDGTNNIHRMDLLVLLDLIGAPDPKYYSYHFESQRWYSRLASIEDRLIQNRMLSKYSYGHPEQRYFELRSLKVFIDDDHRPFMNKNVPILHIIPREFPDCWHKPTDNKDVLDYDAIENQNKMLRTFVAEYLHLDIV